MKKVHAKNNLCRPVVHGYEAKWKEAGVARYTSARLVALYPDPFVIIEFVVQKFTRHISFHVGMIPIQSIYDKNLMKFSSNIKKSINIVKYQIHSMIATILMR